MTDAMGEQRFPVRALAKHMILEELKAEPTTYRKLQHTMRYGYDFEGWQFEVAFRILREECKIVSKRVRSVTTWSVKE